MPTSDPEQCPPYVPFTKHICRKIVLVTDELMGGSAIKMSFGEAEVNKDRGKGDIVEGGEGGRDKDEEPEDP